MWLSIDTSSSRVSLALGQGTTCLQEIQESGNASELIGPLMTKLNPDFLSLTQCFISQGPGSYNGLRVGFGFLKGLLVTDPKPVTCVPTPFVLARQCRELVPEAQNFLIINNARRNEIYAGLVQFHDEVPVFVHQKTADPKLILEDVSHSVDAIVSFDYQNGQLPFSASIPFHHILPSAGVLGILTMQAQFSSSLHLSKIEPFYVRPPVPTSSES